MTTTNGAEDRRYDDIVALGARGLPRDEYFAELSERLRRVVDNDASCFHTLDPHTRLLTSDSPKDLIERGLFTPESASAAGEIIVRSEYLIGDVNGFAELAGKRIPVNTLEAATGGDPESSARYRELLKPADIPHELRAAFVIRGRVWGSVHMARREASGPFSQRDIDVMTRMTKPIAEGIRASLRFDAARRGGSAEAPGLVVIGPGDEVELITAPAVELLAAMRSDPRYAEDEMPSAVLALASHMRRTRTGDDTDVVTVPGADGWITLHGSLPNGANDGRVAIVIEHATGPYSATVRLEAHGVTSREREVATLLARGMSNSEIAEELVLSPHTVQDHIKSIYEKLEVSSRQELVARVFLDEYLPEVIERTPLTSRGRFETS